ncbi:MAG: YigZ family protein [Lentisphaeria bacterium]|nr:YigZ family protein [Lentisphaeria bacterium]
MKTGYPVPAGPVEVELRFKNSRFIGVAGFAETVEAARQFIQTHRERFPDARHHVYAFVVGFGASMTCGMSDDGEPSGTAGRPVLTVLQGSGLGDTVVVVIRYFGGTKLGTGGLVKAYTETTQAAIALIKRRDKVHTVTFTLQVPYPLHQACRHLFDDCGVEVENELFGAGVEMVIRVAEQRIKEVDQRLRDASAGQLTIG